MAGESRKAFQEWYEADAMPLEANWFAMDDADEFYKSDHVETAWQGWRACWEFLSKQKS